MNKRLKKILLSSSFIIVLIVVAVILVEEPLPKFIRYQINKSVFDLNVEGIALENISDLEVRDVPIRIYNSSDQIKSPILYIPGGAFIAGNLDTHDNICRYLATELNAVIVSVDYRKAPENKYPLGLNDVENIFSWMISNEDQVKINNNPPILIGDSGGGNFCAVLSQKHKDQIGGQVLINPALDLTPDGPAFQNWQMFVEWYLNDLSETENENVSPLTANSFRGLPPTVIITCERDPLKTDGQKYKQYLEENDVEVTYKEFEEFGHLANMWAAAPEETLEVRKFVLVETKRLLESNEK